MPNDKQSRAELRQHLGGVSVDLFGGDNLAIFLASGFEPGIEDEALDESGTWRQGAIDATNTVLDAIHAHYSPTIEALEAENARLREDYEGQKEQVATFATKLTSAKATIKRMRKALTPFADAAYSYDPEEGDDAYAAWAHEFTIGSLRLARSALNPERAEK
ncbi:hypothetical protein [Paradevosia shaoguanensis]|uniref:hypothetical protein n=1 Tax=Paradevosia shaoguanensis TaxID=1335043 RepID=UPI001933765A|nr:hypothetical protein [Paradevosia shaoguanensis]